MTTFTTRKTIRDTIAGLFTTEGSWQAVYSGMPKYSVLAGISPVCTVLSNGTDTGFESLNKNPRIHKFTVTNWVLYSNESDGWTYDEAEDLLDTLEFTGAQIIRDNAAGSGVADLLQFESGFSQIDRIVINNNYRYITESRVVLATLASGAL